MMRNFTEEELMLAKSVDLCQVASALGYTVKRIGKYHTLKEMDSIRIYNRSHWFRWSKRYERGENGGSQIDFLRVFQGMTVKDAVFWLLDFAGYVRTDSAVKNTNYIVRNPPKEEKKEFILPEYAGSNQYLYRYLMEQRGISKSTIDSFISKNLIYEAKNYHNIVFVGNDKLGTPRFASMRGVFDKDGKGFKCDVAGNDKCYGFNVVNEDSDAVVVFEAAIDLMSYMDIYQDRTSNMIALGMLADAPLETFLKEHPQIHTIRFCLDGDEPGRKAAKELMLKYTGLGYETEDCSPPKGYKDINEWLVACGAAHCLNRNDGFEHTKRELVR